KVNAAIPKTASYVQWAAHPNWVTGQEYTSYDIKNVVQEIIGQAGWDGSDKSMAFHLSPIGGGMTARYAWTFDGDPAKAPLLHIEYGQAPAGVGTDPPVITLSTTELGRSAFEGTAAEIQRFFVMNSGATALNATAAVVYNKGSGWLSLTPAAGSVSLGPGEEQNYTINFNTAGLTAGTYDAVIRFTDAAASNSPQELRVSLAIIPQGRIQCGDIPLYTQNIASPAVMILLDLSGSMLWEIDLVKEGDVLPATPNLSPVVQEIVNRDGWASGNAITFIIDKVSGSGVRYARSFDGYNPSAALLHVDYTDGTGSKSIDTRIKKATDDGECANAIPFSTSTQKLTIGNCGVALRFEGLTIPKGAAISNAWIQFVPYQTLGDPITVAVSAHASDNSPTFSTAVMPQLMTTQRPRTAASVSWSVEPWTGVTIETKVDVAKTVIGELVKDTGISWGLGSWANDQTDSYGSAIDYTKIHAGCNAHTAEHQAKLQAAVAGLKTYSSTPYAPSMDAGRKYFNKEKAEWDPVVNAEVGVKFEDASCQPKFLIEVSDGMGNVPSMSDTGLYGEAFNTWYKNLVATKANALADAGVSAIGVGFGIPEGEEEQIYTLAEVANARGKASTSDGLYPMHAEDPATGKGLPYLATNKDQLLDVFRSIMNNVKGAVFYGSAPAATTSTDQGDVVILSSFNAGNWTGEIEAIGKNSQGGWQSSKWKASQRFPTTRNVWTVNSSNTLVGYTADTLSGDNYLCKNLGDIIHSTPAVVGEPPFFYPFDGYSGFKRAHSVTSPRQRMIYVGSNDGLLHAFSMQDGSEKWAFLPKSLHAKLNQAASGASYDPCSSSYCHQSLLDGSPQVADVFARFGGANKEWRTMLVVGQRAGGTAYTALDVTSGKGFNDSSSPARFLWEFTDADLGESWADPVIERVRDAAGANERAWGVYFSSGYSENDNTQYLKEAFLYGLEADTGNPLWSDGANPLKKIPLRSQTGTLNFTNNTTGSFAAGEVVRGGASGAIAVMDACIVLAGGTTGQMFLSQIQGAFVNGEALLGSLGHTAVANGTLAVVQAAQKNNALGGPATGS
ncbi:MAG: PilC/PilY family type IV pilus protein, partial [Gammaproteobacteria bacterium]|nr:PilC/PilY family type IV pilus protein [Gammaproteobacteria bacterium]